MVHGIYAADSRNLSVRSAFPFLWEAEKRRGSVVGALFRGLGKEREEERVKRVKEEEAWNALGEYGERMRKGVSVWGLKGGLGTLTERLRVVLEEERGVKFLMGESVEGLALKGEEGVEVSRVSFCFVSFVFRFTFGQRNLNGSFSSLSIRSPPPNQPSQLPW